MNLKLGLLTTVCAITLLTGKLFADDTVKITVATQSYHCIQGAQLDCQPLNTVQQSTVQLKRNGGSIGVEDKARGLSADVSTSLDGNNIVYDVSICSSQSCSLSTVTSDSTGKINQLVSGQYNITLKSYDIIAFVLNTNSGFVDIHEKIQQRINKLK